jgi:nucleotide-binding universal stress UspA family protein
MTERILVASDGRPGALGALRIARLLAERDGCRVQVVAVHGPVETDADGATAATACPAPSPDVDAAGTLRRQVEAQLAEIGVPAGDVWKVHVLEGEVAPGIARAAEDTNADVVLLGLQLDAPGDRASGGRTVIRVVRSVHVPVLAVPNDATALPVRAVVAVDTSESSLRAADQVLVFLSPGAALHLVHVLMEPAGLGLDDVLSTWMATYRVGIEHQLDALAAALHKRSGVCVDIHLLSGDAARSVLEFSDQVGAELIATGSHGLGFVGRLFLGSTSDKIVRGARCGVLIAPPPKPAAGEIADRAERGVLQSSSAWSRPG